MAETEMQKELAQMEKDYEMICFEGMEESEKEICRQYLGSISDNIRKHIGVNE